jgi:hypothetical protein
MQGGLHVLLAQSSLRPPPRQDHWTMDSCLKAKAMGMLISSGSGAHFAVFRHQMSRSSALEELDYCAPEQQ